ncbi:MAG: mannitol dehydrogenase family protein [Alphaproteobacteria bacterium]
MQRLDHSQLATLPASVGQPDYDRGAVTCGIVHLGVGAFHRAHQAVYTDAILKNDSRWGICGISLQSARTHDALTGQDCLYTVVARGADGDHARVIGAIAKIMVARQNPEGCVAALADPSVRIVTLTITEKGYCHDPATGHLDPAHLGIVHDLAHPIEPTTAPGMIVAALARRRAAGTPAFTVLSCDNLPANGVTTGQVLADYARLRDPDLGAYVAGEVATPSTMVDRIVPATTDADRALVAKLTGLHDAWPVMTEPFSQWVIEDHFPQGRPPWAKAGAELVADVAPFEHMKLRLLNASHSSMAYLGLLAGLGTVDQAIASRDLAWFIAQLMAREMAPTLTLPAGVNVAKYQADLIARFANPALKHNLAQIAMDGSQKLPQRLLAAARHNLANGRDITLTTLAVAAWIRFMTGRDDGGQPLPVNDPMAEAVLRAAGPGSPPEQAGKIMEMGAIFGPDLAGEPRFAAPVARWCGLLAEFGAGPVLQQFRQAGKAI